MIHATALVDPAARLGSNVRIGAYSIIGPHVEIGDNTEIGPHVVIRGDLEFAGGLYVEGKVVGKLVAERAVAAGITAVVFDRGSYLYHGRVKALADAARAGGLAF